MGDLRPPYRPPEAAALLGIGRSWLVQKAADGEIPGAHRTNGDSGHWRFDPDKFDRYVQDLRAGKVSRRVRPVRKGGTIDRKPRDVQVNEWLESFRRERVG